MTWPRHLVQRRIQTIHRPLHYLFGFASISPFKAERFEGIDALGVEIDIQGAEHTLDLVGEGKPIAASKEQPHGIAPSIPCPDA